MWHCAGEAGPVTLCPSHVAGPQVEGDSVDDVRPSVDLDLTRRDFLKTVAGGTAAVAMTSTYEVFAIQPDDTAPPDQGVWAPWEGT